jgi:5-methylthioadenosine/S-adenosylhomocysteine deaminase
MAQRFTARAAVVGNRAGTVIPDAVVDVDDGRIRWVGPAAEAPPVGDADVVALPGVLIPGLVNAHSHAPMVLFRGQGEGLPLDRWLREVMWPQ